MRRRLVVSTIAIVLVVLGALAVPIGIVVNRAAESELRSRLDADAAAVGDAIVDDLRAGDVPTAAELGLLVGDVDGVRVLDGDGTVLVERIPAALDDPIVASRPGPDGGRIEVLADRSPLEERFREQVFILLGLAGGALLAAAALAALQARQLAVPLERVAASAARLGDGDFSAANLRTTGIPEIDHISGALRTSGTRVADMLSTERHFTADATHQLRTGLAGISMRFELLTRHADPEVVAEADAGLAQTDQLNTTIDELLALTRDRSMRERGEFDLVGLVDDHVAEWSPRFTAAKRGIAVVTISRVPVIGTKGLAGQVLDVLIDNALRHGRGTVSVLIDGPAVVVVDQGPGISDEQAHALFEAPSDPAAPHGRGLALARRLAEVDGGSVEVLEPRPMRVRYRLVRA